MTLDDKHAASMAALQDLAASFPLSSVWIAWTGGKDSTLALALWRECLKSLSHEPPRALGVDTGLEFSEVLDFRRIQAEKWGVELRIFGSKGDAGSSCFEPADPLQCCRKHKVEPLRQAVRELKVQVLLTGLRREEHASRRERQLREKRSDPEYLQVNPLLEWSEMDVWAYHLSTGLPYCSLYEQGYRSLDCKPCTAVSGSGERAGRNPAKERHLAALRELGYF